jgi:hypothetical protein
MFQFYDKTRRRIALTAFFLLCLAPTAAVVGWCIAWRVPWHVHSEAERLSRQLGVDVSLDALRHPRPGVVVYEGLKLSDPETGRVVLRCRALEATWTKMTDAAGNRRPAVVLAASQPEIEAAAVERLWQLVQGLVQGQRVGMEAELRLTAGELTLSAGENSQTLADVEAGMGAAPGGVQAEAAFRLAGANTAGEPVRLRLVRNRQVTPPANGFEMDTAGVEVPCPLLSLGPADFGWLGPASRFRGWLWANQAAGGWNCKVVGQLRNVDLNCLVSEQFPHKLSGTADIDVQHARFQHGRLEEAVGALSAGPGVIGRSLVNAAAAHLRLARPDDGAAAGDLLPYTQLALTFQIAPGGLRLEGRCTGTAPGTVLADDRGRLLGSPAVQPQPVVALIQTLVPANEIQVPATRQTDWLARRLPVPDVLPPRNARADLPHAQLQLRHEQKR